MVVDVSRSNAQRELYLEGERFVAEAALVASLVAPGRPAIDVGANIGYYVLLLRQAGASRVMALEPDSDNVRDLRRLIAANNFSDVEVREVAVGAAGGRVRFQPGLNGAVMATGEHVVEMVTLDDVAPLDVGFIKIDVEGYEHEVLNGARRVIEELRPNLFVEMHPSQIPDRELLDTIIADMRSTYGRVELYGNPRHTRGLRGIAQRFQPPKLPKFSTWEGDVPFWLVARR